MNDLVIKNGLVYLNGKWVNTNIYVSGEKISYIGNEKLDAKEEFDASSLKIIPGLIDPHVHFELPFLDMASSDDFYYGSVCAAYGGVTSIVDFVDGAHNADELEENYKKRCELAKKSIVDYHLHSCIFNPDGDIEEFVKRSVKLGMRTIKLFTTYSDTNRRTYDKDIIELLKLSKKYNVLILVHAENDNLIDSRDNYTFKDLSTSRPSMAELSEVIKLCNYAKTYDGNLYIVHCSSGETLKAVKEQFGEMLGKNLFIESCPQYFVFNNSVLNKEEGRLFTFAPPLRSERERQLLVANFDSLSTIATDHCSFMKADKISHTYLPCFPFGIGGIEHSFNLMYRRFGDKVIDKMSKNVALIEDFPSKGEIRVGADADLAFFKEEEDYFIKENHGKCDYSIYEGVLGAGEFKHTMLRGKFILKDRKLIGAQGKMIKCGGK